MSPTLSEAQAVTLAEERMAEAERLILAGTHSGISLGGVSLEWRRKPKKDGGALRRKGAWGEIVYLRTEESYWDTVPREDALKEMVYRWSTPGAVQYAVMDAERVLTCAICDGVGQGANELCTWGQVIRIQDWRIRVHADNWTQDFDPLFICDGCISKLQRGLIGRVS